MNCLGVVMYSDVHDHFVTKIAEKERQKRHGIHSTLPFLP